jgi:hypothetical protein
VCGTSEATPLIAAYYALLGSAAQGPSWAYANAGLLNDPSSGLGGQCSGSIGYICQAGTGYDGPTGVGSISGAAATGAPGIGGPGTNGTYTQDVTSSTAQLQGGVYPNGSDTTYWWEYGTTTAYGEQTAAVDIGSGNAATAVTDTLGGLEPGTTYHYRLAAQNGLGTEYGYDFTLTTTGSGTRSSPAGPGSGAPGSTGGAPTTPPDPTPPATTTTTPPATTTPPTDGSTGSAGDSGAAAGSAPAKPTLSGPRIGAASSTATISATVSTGGAGGTYVVSYGTTPGLGHSIAGGLVTSATGLSATLRNLRAGGTYYVRVTVTNAAGSATSAVVRFRTSAVTIAGLTIRGGRVQAILRCHGSAPCRVRLQARSGARLVASGNATVRGNRTMTVTLRLSHAFLTALRSHGTHPLTLSALSSWNGYPAGVTATR